MKEIETVLEGLRRLGYHKFCVITFTALTQRLRKFEKSEYTMIFGKGRRKCLTMCQLGAHISYSLRLLFHLI